MRITVFAICVLLASTIQAQLDTVWTKTLGGSKVDAFGSWPAGRASSFVTENGDIVTAATTTSIDGMITNSIEAPDVWIVKLNSKGDTLWTKLYGGNSWDVVTDIVQSQFGGFYICGYTYSNSNDFIGHHGTIYETDGFIAKFDDNGNKIWIKQYGGYRIIEIGGDDYLYSVKEFPNGTVMAVGETNSINGELYFDNTMFNVGWILHIDSLGNVIDSKKIVESAHSEWNANQFLEIQILPENSGYVVLGQTFELINSHNIWVVRFDKAGQVVWSKAYGSASQTWACDLHVTNKKEIYAVGWVQSGGRDVADAYIGGYSDTWLIKLDYNDGSIIRQRLYGGEDGYEWPYVLTSDCDGNVVVGGATSSSNFHGNGKQFGGGDFWMFSINQKFDTLWTFRAGGSESDFITSINFYDDCNVIYLSGRTNSNNEYVHGNHGDRDIWIAKTSFDQTGIYDYNTNDSQIVLYPNPVQDLLNISSLKTVSDYEFTICDITGREVYRNKIKNNLFAEYQIDIRFLTSGLYFFNYIENDKAYQKKFIKY